MAVIAKIGSNIRIYGTKINVLSILKTYSTSPVPHQENVFEGEENHKMAAWQIHSYGGLEELQLSKSVRKPYLLNPNDVLIKVAASSVNPIDIAMMGKHF